ncbi:MAG: three-Cys-motif partner protein TcmP [Cyclobacteriaceae bacterium]|nr:three-Cys-motif partner protein TcmP [Cyclobacteriaceae bacterium]
MSTRFRPLIQVQDDGLHIPEVREWALEKYSLVGGYGDIFTSGMYKKWNQLAYIDLFAGAGYARIKETGKIYKSSALISLSLPHQYTKYVFCEKDDKCFEALQIRVKRDFPNADVSFVHGDCNEKINEIKGSMPSFSRGNTLLPFCFVDPYSLNLCFKTIQVLAETLMDFLILQALHMDANRNFDNYMSENSQKIEQYLDDKEWRKKFDENSLNKKDFVKFLFDQYHSKMLEMQYQPEKQAHQIKSNVKNLPLYYLAFYTKHPRGNDFFDKARKYVNPQLGLF